jgi:hypothetical protein
MGCERELDVLGHSVLEKAETAAASSVQKRKDADAFLVNRGESLKHLVTETAEGGKQQATTKTADTHCSIDSFDFAL